MKSPQLAFSRFITERLKRNRDLKSPAIACQNSFGLHHDVDAEVRAGAFGHNSISLHAQRIPAEHIGPALIVEGVEKNSHVVIAKDFVALGHCRADLVRLIVTMKGQVE